METALYDPERGYYNTHLKSIPDYVTAPNFGPYLGRCVARQIAQAWNSAPAAMIPKVFTLVEVGCGGQPHLTRAVLEAWEVEQPKLFEKTQMILVDRSPTRLGEAVASLSSIFPGKVFGSPDISQIPQITGVIVSNELLDAFPVRLIRKTLLDTVEEAYVEADAHDIRQCQWRPCADPVLVSCGLGLPTREAPYAFNPGALRYLEAAVNRLEHGLVMTIDYGDTQPAVMVRSPVKAFASGQIRWPDFNAAGSEDITSPVDFTLLMDWGSRLGLETIYYDTLGKFLIQNGIADFLKEPHTKKDVAGNLNIKTLIHPYGFGEDFKVLLQGK